MVKDFLLTLQPKGGSSAQETIGLSSETVRLCCPLWHLLFLRNSDKEGKFAFTLALCKQSLLSLYTKCLLQPRYKGVSFHVYIKWGIMEARFYTFCFSLLGHKLTKSPNLCIVLCISTSLAIGTDLNANKTRDSNFIRLISIRVKKSYFIKKFNFF